MNTKLFVFIGMTLGSIIGGFIPNLWGAGALSMSGIIWSGIGAMFGVWGGYKVSKMI